MYKKTTINICCTEQSDSDNFDEGYLKDHRKTNNTEQDKEEDNNNNYDAAADDDDDDDICKKS